MHKNPSPNYNHWRNYGLSQVGPNPSYRDPYKWIPFLGIYCYNCKKKKLQLQKLCMKPIINITALEIILVDNVFNSITSGRNHH